MDAKAHSERELGQHIMETHDALSEIPSEVASKFRAIAAQLKVELEERDRNDPSMTDTVVMPVMRARK